MRDPLVVLVAPPGAASSTLEEEIRAAGFAVDFAGSPAAIAEGLASGYTVLVVDVDAPRLGGMEIVTQAHARDPRAAIVALIAPGDEARGLAAMERGATGFMARPGSARRLGLEVRRAVEHRDLWARVHDTEANLAHRFTFERIVGESAGLVRARDALRRAVATDQKVLLTGEAGTGKDLFAQVLHRAREARVAGAAGAEGAPGELRIELPPLRERTGDVPLLVDHFVRAHNREHGRRVTGMTRGALAHFEAWSWPGNVRELAAVLEGMIVFTDARRPLDVSDLPLAMRVQPPDDRGKVTLSLAISLAEAEKCFLEETLRDVGYDRARAAETLGIGLRTLYRKLKEYEIG